MLDEISKIYLILPKYLKKVVKSVYKLNYLCIIYIEIRKGRKLK